jgi:SAM-dependent methyltransferase
MLSSTPAVYKEALGILASCSEHIPLIAKAIKTNILPRLANKGSMIDVGAGLGKLTEKLETEFDEITVLDINSEVRDELTKHEKYEVIISDFFDFQTDKKYDFVLCSHVMYHFNKTEMKSFIDKLQSLVKPGGYCFIALIAPRGRNHNFHIQLNPEYVNSSQIINILEEDNIPFERIEATAHRFITNSRYPMECLLKFLAVENCFAKQSASLGDEVIGKINRVVDEALVEAKVSGSDDNYVFAQEDEYVVIHCRP